MAQSRTLTVNVRIDGLRETLRAYNRLPKAASDALRDQSLELARAFARKAQMAATADEAPQSRLLVPTIRATRDRVPVVQVGGTKRVGRNRAPAWAVLFGAEFGSNRFPQFGRVHSGRRGYWFFPLVEENADDIAKAWRKAADDILRAWSGVR